MPFLYLILSFSLFLFYMMAGKTFQGFYSALFISGYMDIQAVLERLRALFNLVTSLRALTLNFLTKTHSICVQSTRMGRCTRKVKNIDARQNLGPTSIFLFPGASCLLGERRSDRSLETSTKKTIMLRRTR